MKRIVDVMKIRQRGNCVSVLFCPHCGNELSLDYCWDDEGDEVPYYMCSNFDFDDDMGYGGGDEPLYRYLLRDKETYEIIAGPTVMEIQNFVRFGG